MILVKNGRIIDPETKRDEVIDIIIKDGKIYRIGKYQITDEYERVIDALGYVVAPGLIDVHSHFRDPGFTYKEDIESGCKAAAKGGYTTVICMANTNPVVDNKETLSYIKEKAEKAKIRVLQTASITKNMCGEELTDMEKLLEAGAVGFTDDGYALKDTKTVLGAMQEAKRLDTVLSFHEEDPSLIDKAGVNKGKVSEELGIPGASHCAEDVMVARDCMLALETGAKVNIQHVSSGNSVELIRLAKKLGANIWAEVSPHHFSLTEEAVKRIGANAKMNPPLRTEDDRFKLIEGLKDDTLELIATDHAPHSAQEKEKGLLEAPSGIIGLETALALGNTYLVRKGHLTMMKLLGKMTYKPARLYALNAGIIKDGGDADLVIFDPSEAWIVKSDFASKSNNSPFIGEKLYGKIKFTICNGAIVYEEN
ncbi:dihydroorotase [Sinanaerobacter sp. ZZT-01]|uniref:dihydroorotase n=1 Tax=Sinanaerobacter sp. ZZT-01 TaxID=3111540 RepID=UPI002D76A978|nr:dihydroorotase [Sinanaerobacter sp. ZZT-01]WRR94586.1 dihydroorotase [Sinanaerobacter sp. ZZT-01]